jgi:uncharacterized protein (TIGR03067 family)
MALSADYASGLRFLVNLQRRFAVKRHALMVLVAGVLLAADSKDDDIKKEQKKINGTWAVESFVNAGMKVPEDDVKKFRLTLDGDKYTLKQEDNVVSKGTAKIDPSKKPKTIDITPTEGDGQGTAMLGIYEINGDTYKVCYVPGGKDRPTKFASEEGSDYILFVFKRVKP